MVKRKKIMNRKSSHWSESIVKYGTGKCKQNQESQCQYNR